MMLPLILASTFKSCAMVALFYATVELRISESISARASPSSALNFSFAKYAVLIVCIRAVFDCRTWFDWACI